MVPYSVCVCRLPDPATFAGMCGYCGSNGRKGSAILQMYLPVAREATRQNVSLFWSLHPVHILYTHLRRIDTSLYPLVAREALPQRGVATLCTLL